MKKKQPIVYEIILEGVSEPESCLGMLIPLDNPWKSLSPYMHPHCHTWQRGHHIDTLAN